MRICRILQILFILSSLSGCWVAITSNEPVDSQVNIGKNFPLNRDILIVSYWFTPISWEINAVENIGSNQEVIETLRSGSEIKIESVKSFRLPNGISYAYRCIEVKSGIEFDLTFKMKDSIGL